MMTACNFQLDSGGVWTCAESGWQLLPKTVKPPHGVCPICGKKRFLATVKKRVAAKFTPEQRTKIEKTVAETEQKLQAARNDLSEACAYDSREPRRAALTTHIIHLERQLQAVKAVLAKFIRIERRQAEAIEAGKELGWTEEEATQYTHALMRWMAEGKPIRTDEEVVFCVEICQSNKCKKYKPDTNTCGAKQCGLLTPGLEIEKMARLAILGCPGKWW